MAGYVKGPNDIIEYGFDWDVWLDGASINNSAWVVDLGITIDGNHLTSDNKAKVALSGGTLGSKYCVTNTITLDTGEIKTRSLTIAIEKT